MDGAQRRLLRRPRRCAHRLVRPRGCARPHPLPDRRRAHRLAQPAGQAEARHRFRGVAAGRRGDLRRRPAQHLARPRPGNLGASHAARRHLHPRKGRRTAVPRTAVGHPSRPLGQRVDGPGPPAPDTADLVPGQTRTGRAAAPDRVRGRSGTHGDPRLGPDAARHPGTRTPGRGARVPRVVAPGQPGVRARGGHRADGGDRGLVEGRRRRVVPGSGARRLRPRRGRQQLRDRRPEPLWSAS